MQNDDSVTKITWEQLLEEYFFFKESSAGYRVELLQSCQGIQGIYR